MTENKIKKFKIVSKPKVYKEFRLFDFQTFDKNTVEDEEEEKQKFSMKFQIRMFGINETGETCMILVDNYLPFFYIQFMQGRYSTEYEVENWFRAFRNNKDLPKYIQKEFIQVKLEDHKKLYDFTGNKSYSFVKCVFSTMRAFRECKNRFSRNKQYCVLYESNIPPLLRYFHIYNISPSGWVRLRDEDIIDSNTTTCNYEYECSVNHIHPLPHKETPVPYKIASFDIEASSSHGDFPLPVKDYKRFVSQLVDTLQVKMAKQQFTVSAMNTFLKKAILASFNYSTMNGIDLVYTKRPTTKEEINSLYQQLIKLRIGDDTVQSTANPIFTISSMFEALSQKEMYQADGDDEGGGGGEDDTNAQSSTVEEYSHAKSKYPKSVVPKISYTEEQKTQTIAEYLIKTEHTREQKIQTINIAITGLFPALQGDQITFIGTTFLRYGQPEPYRSHCLVVGGCNAVEGSDICSVRDEKQCILDWTQLIQDENPDIIIGYNIFGFDYQFMFQRAKELDIVDEFCSLSRIQDEVCVKEDYKTQQKQLDHTQNHLASGDYDLHYPPISGRLQIDLLFYFRRDYNLSSYKLDDVAGTMIRDDIKGMKYVESNHTTQLYSKNLAGLHEQDFIHIEISSFTTDYYANGKKFRVLHIERNVEVVDDHDVPNGTYNVITIEGDHSGLSPKQYNLKWGMAKDDVTPQDIFRLAKESDASRAIVAKYCIQDCNLVHHLMNKVDVITGYIEMSRICNVPIHFLVFRGQGIKLTSYVAKVCREKDTLMPDLEKTQSDDGYEGAIVLPPKCMMYGDNPVACVDYSSLYPSIAKGWNLSPDSKVWTKNYDNDGKLIKINGKKVTDKNLKILEKEADKYDNLPEYSYINVVFDSFEQVQRTTSTGKPGRKEKVKSGYKVVRWAQFPNGQEGIIPCIIGDLLKARKETRVKAENEPDPFLANVLDKRQLGYKVTANSLYGQMGSSVSTFFEKDVAASITAIGRMMITYAKRMIEDIYGNSLFTSKNGKVVCTKSTYVYGDSVANYTPVYVKVNNLFEIVAIEHLAEKYGDNKWMGCVEEGKEEKEVCELDNVETWTDKGWTKLYRIIRHKLAPHKKMVRIVTHTGLVDATDDHSLILNSGEEISPKNCAIGTELLHNKLPINDIDNEYITEDEARIMGFFFGDGSCGNYNCPSGVKSSWALNNASMEIINKYIELCRKVYIDFEWRIIPSLESSGVYKISPKCSKYGSISKFVKQYRGKMYYCSSKIIPFEVMNSNLNIRKAFFEGLYDADGDKDENGYTRIDQKNQISASYICWLASSIGYSTSLNTRNDKPNIYRITMTKSKQRKNPLAIKKLHEIDYDGYVYDLTTENHHFAAGIGNLIVHNTDSVFFTFNLEDPTTGAPIRGKNALEFTIEIAQEAAHLCSLYLPPPMKLTYEKTLMSFILLSKKRYVGMLYEMNPNKGKLKFMGLPLKRRDSCDYLKDVYGGILTILMKEPENIEKAIEFLNQSLQNLIKGKVSIDKLALTKALRSDYKNPAQIAHKVLADRIGEREPGNKPKPGDRIQYAFIESKEQKLLGDRIETLEYIAKHKVPLDYHYYITNQLMNPLLQLFSLALDKVYLYKKCKQQTIIEMNSVLDKMYDECDSNLELYMKKREKYCSAEIKKLLFDPFLVELYNARNGIRTLLQFYHKV
jgi:DNA polymerase elongation subunit (family B)